MEYVDGVGPGADADDRGDGLQDPVQVGDVARRRGDRGEDFASARLNAETLLGLLFVGEVRDDDLGPPGRSVSVSQKERSRFSEIYSKFMRARKDQDTAFDPKANQRVASK